MQRFCVILLFNILGVWIRLKLIWQYWRTCCSGKGRGSTETQSKLFANHNALGQLTNHNTFSFSEGGPSSNPELIKPFVPGWGERYCNNVNYVKNNAIFEPLSMRVCSSTPPKQNQDFVKGHNRTPLILFIKFKIYILKSGRLVRLKKKTISTFIQLGRIKLIKSVSKDIYKVTKVFLYFI